jgi:predicted GNAT family acetyltransferase
MSKRRIQNWEAVNKDIYIDFLYQHKETALLLLDNFQRYGAELGDEIYSGNFKVILDNDGVCAIFSLTRSGNLLIQSDKKQDYSAIIYESCLYEKIPITGFVGNWYDGENFWKYIQKVNPKIKSKNLSKEKLYSLDLSETSGVQHPDVCFLTVQDFDRWYELDHAYSEEKVLPRPGTIDQHRHHFEQKVLDKLWWGYYETTVGCLNAYIDGIAQIGGVYTHPSHRRKGHAKKLMEKIIADSYHIHNIHTLILFTGEDNIPAQKLYEALGFVPIGYFGLLFWDF